jgi:hypothetical protein
LSVCFLHRARREYFGSESRGSEEDRLRKDLSQRRGGAAQDNESYALMFFAVSQWRRESPSWFCGFRALDNFFAALR